MGSVYPKRRANGSRCFVAQITLPSKERISQTFSTRNEAMSWIAEMEAQGEAETAVTSAPFNSVCKPFANRLQTRNSTANHDLCAVNGNSSGNDFESDSDESLATISPIRPRTISRNSLHLAAGEAKPELFSDVIDRYIKEIMPQKRSTRAPIQQLGFWRSRLGHLYIHQITPSLIAKAKSELLAELAPGERQRKPATINRYLAILCHVFTIAMKEWFIIAENPAHRVRKCKESQGRTYFLSEDEHARLLKALKTETPVIQAAVTLALYTGMRHGEIMGLKWRNVDLSRAIVRLEMTKNGRPRSVPLVGKALLAMKHWASLYQGEDTELLFPSTVNASVPFDIRRGWERLKNRIGMPHLHFHDLRHTTASYMAMSGATPQEIADVLGHRTLQMVKRYSHLAEGHSRTALDRMAKVLGNAENDGEEGEK